MENSDKSVSEDNEFDDLNKLNPDVPEQEAHESQSINQQSSKVFEQKRNSHEPDPEEHKRQSHIANPKKELKFAKQNKPRLIIDRMVLNNFKSYAGKQTIGPFHNNFSSIVGPNGSGKSNLIESMLFIFGFSASWMRLNKLNQLIHNSSTLTNVQSASVEVHFKKVIDNNNGTTSVLPDSAFSIRRTVNSASVSKYFLNNADSTQAQVKTKLKSEGIDLTNNRFLILQGQVQQISQMKQKSGDRDKPGFLEYLEDIIGSNQFIDKIEEAVKEYNEAEEIKHEKGERMKVVQNQLRGMNNQKQQAIRYVKKQRKIFQIQSVLNQVHISNSTFQLNKIKDKIADLEANKDRIIKEEKEKLNKQAERVKQIKIMRAQVEKIEKQKIREEQKIAKLSAQDKIVRQQVKYHLQDEGRFEKKMEELNQELLKIVNEGSEINEGLPQKKKKLQAEREELNTMKTQLSKHDRPELKQKIKKIETQMKDVDFKYNSYNEKKKLLQHDVQKMSSNVDNHQQKIQEYKQNLAKDLQMKAKVQIAYEQAQKDEKATQRKLYEQEQLRKKLRNQMINLDFVIKDKRTQNHQQGQFNNLFNSVMKANIPGVLGRLGDLGTIPKQYDSVLTSASFRLDNIVVTDLNAAQAVLSLLKRNDLGRATCIILDKIENFRDFMNKPFDCPHGAVRLFDLIKPQNQEVRAAFYFAYSNTLYCQSTKDGLQLAMGDDRNRRRVISRKQRGGFITYQINGLMNSQPERRGGFQRKTAQNKKNNHQDDKHNEARLQELQRQYDSRQEKVKQYEYKIKQLRNNVHIMKSEKIIIEGRLKQTKQEIEQLHKIVNQSKDKKQNVDNIKKELKAIEGQLQKIQAFREKLNKSLQEVQNQQKKHQNSEVTNLRAKYKQLKTDFSKFQKQVEKEQAIIATVQKRVNQNRQKIKGLQKNIKKTKQLCERGNKRVEQLEAKGQDVYNNVTAFQKALKQAKAKQQELKAGLDEDQHRVNESRKKIQQAKALVDNAKMETRKAEGDKKFAEMQLDRIRKLYSQMTSTYDFLSELEQIQQMNLATDINSNSILDISIQNRSLQSEGQLAHGRKSIHERRTIDHKFIEKLDPHKNLTESELDPFLLMDEKLRQLLSAQGGQLKKMQGKNLQVISEFRTKFKDYKQKLKQFQQVKQKQITLKKMIDQLKQERFTLFRSGFSVINSKLKEVYQLLTNGGDAELQLIDALDPFSDGINFSVRPPKKAWKEINKLSGGQKTLSSLSLIFALHYYKPTPLYFMDEIDAALDFKNVSIVGDYIKKRTKDAQFIIISLRNNMFDLADKLVGVYKTHDKTKVISFMPNNAKLIKNPELHPDKENKKRQENSQKKSLTMQMV